MWVKVKVAKGKKGKKDKKKKDPFAEVISTRGKSPCGSCGRGTSYKLAVVGGRSFRKCNFCGKEYLPSQERPKNTTSDVHYTQGHSYKCCKCGKMRAIGIICASHGGTDYGTNPFVCPDCNIPLGYHKSRNL